MSQLKHLFSPVQIGSMTLRNRIVMPPIASNLCSQDGFVTERMKSYYGKRAEGAGLVIVENTGVDMRIGKTVLCEQGIDDDKFLPGLKELAEAINSKGARSAVQLHHAGREAKQNTLNGLQPVAPSAVEVPHGAKGWFTPPRELTVSEIGEVVKQFATGADRARRAGFSGVEIHSASGYIINSFLSPASNLRRDQYGGSLENRARFLLEVISAIRGAVGRSHPVWCRLNCREYGVDGLTTEDTKIVARMAQDAGVDAIHCSVFGYGGGMGQVFSTTPGNLMHMVAEIKQAVTVPVIGVGWIDPELGDRIIAEGKADLISIGRGIVVDPFIPQKAASGKTNEILPCIACLHCVDSVVFQAKPMECSVNPVIGRESEYDLKPASPPRKVVVVGSGPGGMEAARVAALRGHKVTLFEKASALGGQLLAASAPPDKDTLHRLRDYFVTQVEKAGVTVELGKEATPDAILRLSPDAVVLATGITPVMPQIPGIDKVKTVLAEDVLLGKAATGKRVVIIGGALVGCETADFLSERGKQVTVTRRSPRMADDMMPVLRAALLTRLKDKKVTLLAGVKYESITEKNLTITTKEGQRQTLDADSIVIATGGAPDQRLYLALEGKVAERHLIGDAAEPRNIRAAIAEGWEVGNKV